MGYIYEKKSLKMTSLNVVFNAGGLFDEEGKFGTSHLMEHLICKTFDDLQDTLTANCIEFNAYTADEQVVVFFKGLDSRLTPELKKSLVNKLLGGIDCVSEEAFLNERNTVLQEYSDYFNDPGCCFNIIRQKFNYYGPIGKKSDIENFSYKDMKAQYKKFFKQPAKIIEIGPTKTDFSYVKFNENFVVEPKKIKYKKCYKDVELETLPVSPDKKSVICIGKKLIKKADYPYIRIAMNMLTMGLNSPMYQEIRIKQGLSYAVHGEVDEFFNDSYLFFEACTDNENVEKLNNTFKMFFEDISKWLTEARFNDIINSIEVAREQKKIFRYSNINDIIRKGYTCIPKNLKKIEFNKLIEVCKKYITLDNIDVINF